ncbi:S1 family peptidase [Planomonospora parontospora]|uniref:S1 family peptidase n=1 Tax=Planomonospora parontospora TaxID=58119 RepID=UPI00166FF9A0|nr:S1 family peptidase [Planomonospora parontospora]GGL03138.1 serine protease [Planomonospora parontospora subsp. antibiotica]GII13323.1 serine protease [Planomonospora parontospora subsp. antibiotica]
MLRRNAATAGFALALALVATPALAQAGPDDAFTPGKAGAGDTSTALYTDAKAMAAKAPAPAPGLVDALVRDLGIDAGQAKTRLVNEAAAAKVEPVLAARLGEKFGGAWVAGPTAELVVATSDSTQVSAILKTGAQAKVVRHSLATLDAAKGALDAKAEGSPKSIASWYVDVQDNSVVVLARDTAEAQAFVDASGADASLVRVRQTAEQPQPFYDVRGGDAYYMGGRCSVGFSVTKSGSQGGFVTAGHCGDVGTATQGHNRVAQGTFRGSSFPGNDYAWVEVNSQWTPTGVVNAYNSGILPVRGSTQRAVGSSICRAGSTTGYHCGTIGQHNTSVTYPEGTISGVTRTSVCAEPGDSGGSYISGDQAQGVTSGGSGNCSSGGTTYHQPVNEILSAYGLTLATDGGTEPPPPTGCTGYGRTLSGSATSSGQNLYSSGFTAGSGTHRLCLDGPNGVDFDLYLQKQSGSSWVNVASGTSSGPDESFTYNGTSGTYRVRIHAYSGTGAFTVGVTTP